MVSFIKLFLIGMAFIALGNILWEPIGIIGIICWIGAALRIGWWFYKN